jgi:transcription factor IIIB subunit 2
MNRASISEGRRPNGICGAAILIAAGMHGLKRTPAEIAKVVHSSEGTIRQREKEFKATNTA